MGHGGGGEGFDFFSQMFAILFPSASQKKLWEEKVKRHIVKIKSLRHTSHTSS